MPNRPTRGDSPHREAAAKLGSLLREARRAGKLSQQEAAVRAGVSIGTIRALEAGRSVDPSYFTVLSVARALEIAPGDLIGAEHGAD